MISDCLSFLDDLFSDGQLPDFAIRLWEGTTWCSHPGRKALFTIVVNHPDALRRILWSPNQLTIGEAYIYGDFDIEGDILQVFTLAGLLRDMKWSFADKLRFGRHLFGLPRTAPFLRGREEAHLRGKRHSRERDSKAIVYHYDVSNDFYRLWLDERMIYSCGYFSSPDDTLDVAQERKLDYICRKLRLKPGERLLDIGCGWGGLVIYAVLNYGVDAVGITLSSNQASLAAERVRNAGISDRCKVEVCDYRDMQDTAGFDKLASVGMIEHVGEAKLPEYFTSAWHLLKPGGIFLNLGISRNIFCPFPKGPSFISKYVFPDGELLPLSYTLQVAEKCGFEVRDVENLREHYALTVRQWARRLENNQEAALRFVSDVVYRIWRIYLAGSAYSFDSGRNNLHHILFLKSDHGKSHLPLTRDDWYAEAPKGM